jgi:hypothetical protein
MKSGCKFENHECLINPLVKPWWEPTSPKYPWVNCQVQEPFSLSLADHFVSDFMDVTLWEGLCSVQVKNLNATFDLFSWDQVNGRIHLLLVHRWTIRWLKCSTCIVIGQEKYLWTVSVSWMSILLNVPRIVSVFMGIVPGEVQDLCNVQVRPSILELLVLSWISILFNIPWIVSACMGITPSEVPDLGNVQVRPSILEVLMLRGCQFYLMFPWIVSAFVGITPGEVQDLCNVQVGHCILEVLVLSRMSILFNAPRTVCFHWRHAKWNARLV